MLSYVPEQAMRQLQLLVFLPLISCGEKWTYSCKDDDHCVREPVVGSNAPVSQAVCSLTCGTTNTLWPLPITYNQSATITKFSPSKITVECIACDANVDIKVSDVVERMKTLLTSRGGEESLTPEGDMLKINVKIDFSHLKPYVGMDEWYTLRLSKLEALVADIESPTYFGARHALETLFQLAEWDSYNSQFVILDDVWVEALADSVYLCR